MRGYNIHLFSSNLLFDIGLAVGHSAEQYNKEKWRSHLQRCMHPRTEQIFQVIIILFLSSLTTFILDKYLYITIFSIINQYKLVTIGSHIPSREQIVYL